MSSIVEDSGGIFAQHHMKKIVSYAFIILLIIGGIGSWLLYSCIFKDNLKDTDTGSYELFVKSCWNYDSLNQAIQPIVLNINSFNRVADQMNLTNNVRPGLYLFSDSLSNRDLISKLRLGQTEAVKVILTGSLNRNQILPKITEYLEVDSTELIDLMNDKNYLDSLGYTAENWPCLFVANTYFFNWATTADEVVSRFVKEHNSFWNDDRRQQATALGLGPKEVVVLASIVDAETMMDSELPMIAGVYLNRLQQHWPLGADPTIRYLIHEQGRQRVLYVDLEIESPYNTYKNLGLPPGPILLPSVKAIDAVLNAASTEYMFFCAKADFSGYHAFAKTNAQHERNRTAYRRELNRRGIMR
ncbi:MAG: UPF0755 protein, partial [Bacteroidia bacterium]